MLLFIACAEPDVAPRDLDEVLHAAMLDFTNEDSEALAADAAELQDSILADEALPFQGTFSDITDDEVAALGVTRDFDWSTARGMFSAVEVRCTPDEMETILQASNQDDLYVGSYTSYERNYDASLDDWKAGTTDHLGWTTNYGVDLSVLGTYTAEVWSGMHRVPSGPYLYSQTVMPEEAKTEPDSLVFPADFQIEILYPKGEGMVHVFGMWRRIEFGAELTTDDDGTVQIVLDQLAQWDEDTSAICEEGRVGDAELVD